MTHSQIRRSFLKEFWAISALTLIDINAFASSKIQLGLNTALIVVDVQNCFTNGGTLPVPNGDEVIPVINKIAPLFENIIVTQDWHPQEHFSFASNHVNQKPFDVVKLHYGDQVLWPAHCVQGTPDAALHKNLELPSAQLIIRKGFHKDLDSYSAFMEADGKTSTGLAAYLHARNINTVFIAGLATDFCVAWTALDAKAAGFSVYVIEDACRAINLNNSLELAWKNMKLKGIHRIQSSEMEHSR